MVFRASSLGGFRIEPSPPKPPPVVEEREYQTRLYRVWERYRPYESGYEVDADDPREALQLAKSLGLQGYICIQLVVDSEAKSVAA